MRIALMLAQLELLGCGRHASPTPVLGVHIEVLDEAQLHGASTLVLSAPGRRSLTLVENIEVGDPPPFVGQQFPLDETHVLVTGSASLGSGTDNVQGLLVSIEPTAVVLVDRVTCTASRTSVFMVRTAVAGKVALGCLAPNDSESDWSIAWGAFRLTNEDLPPLPTTSVPADAVRLRTPYAPDSARAIWFDVDAQGFHPAAEVTAAAKAQRHPS